jgi:hypothetical protein
MKLQIVKSAIWPVTANIQVDGGKTEPHAFFARFKKLKDSEMIAFEKTYIENNKRAPSEKDLVEHVVEGLGETVELVKSDKKVLKDMLDEPCYNLALYQEYMNFRVGISSKN